MEQYPLMTILATGFTLSYFFSLIATRLRLPPILAYIITGLIIGPYTPGFVANGDLAKEVSGMGVVLLMFGVGLNFSLNDLKSVKSIAVPGAIIQIISSITIFSIISHYLLDLSYLKSLIFGLCVATPSTVVSLKSLTEHRLMTTKRGHITIGWLVIGDIVMITALIIVPSLGALGSIDSSDTNQFVASSLLYEIIINILKILVFVTFMIIIASKVIPLLFRRASSISNEIFTLAIMTFALGLGYFASKLFGISYELAAFISGVVINETEFSERVTTETSSWRDAFAVLFFISIGMLFDWRILLSEPFQILVLLGMIIVINGLIIFLVLKLFKQNNVIASSIAAINGQIGEFTFVLAAIATTLGFISTDNNSVIIGGAIASIIINPFIVKIVLFIDSKVESKQEQLLAEELVCKDYLDQELVSKQHTEASHAVLVGESTVAYSMQLILQSKKIFSVHIEDADHKIEQSYLNEYSSLLVGDTTDLETYKLANIAQAKVVYFLSKNIYHIATVALRLKDLYPGLKIIIVTRFIDEFTYFYQLGFKDTYYAGLEMGISILQTGTIFNFNEEELVEIHKNLIDYTITHDKR